MPNMLQSIAAIGILSAMGSGYGGGSRERARASGPVTEEEKAKMAEEKAAAAERAEKRRIESAERKAAYNAIYNPTYDVEPVREDFPSRPAFRKAHRKWKETNS